MRTRLLASMLACVALSLCLGASTAQAGVRIVAPANDAIKTKAKVRVALAVSGARSLRVSLDGSDVTRRLARHGRLREAVLRGRLVEPGAHWLVVRWRPAEGRAERTVERRFLVARRFRSLAGKLFPRRRVHAASGVLRLRLSVRRGVGLMRARVNGRRVRVPHIGRLWPTTTLTLGARHGLRFGRNRVSVLAHDFTKARYDRESWTVVMRRTRPLAAGIAKHRAEAGGRAVRLDGRGARPTRAGRRLRYSWRIVRKPRGSRASLLGRHRPRPRLRPDVPGSYRLAVTVSEHSRKRGARAAQTGPETVQPATVVADANTMPIGASLEMDLTWRNGSFGSITVDEAPAAGLPDSDDCVSSPPVGSGPRRCVYRLPADAVPYLLVLDALTLAPKAPGIKRVGGQCADDDFRQAIEPWAGQNVIAILAFPGGCYNSATTVAQVGKPSAYVFTPSSKPDLGIRSGWYSEAPDPYDPAPAELQGFFQKSWPVGSKTSPSDQYRFVPGNYVSFDTNKVGAPAGQNTMVVAGKEYTSQLPAGATDGFQVLVLDKTLKPMLGTPTAFTNGAPVGDMARLLQQARPGPNATPGVSTVFVQSIGTPTPPSGSEDAWNRAAAVIGDMGGNGDVFLRLGDGGGSRPAGTTGWYSFVAAPDPGCLPTSPTPCLTAIEASTPLTQRSGQPGAAGDVSGVLGRNQTWQYAPLIDEVGGDDAGELLTLAYRPPSKWPFSGDPDARPILHWLSQYDRGGTDLTSLGNGACYDPGNLRDVRSSYCSIRLNWASLKAGLGDSQTGTGVCANYQKYKAELVGVAEEKYEAVCDQISREIGQLADVKDDMSQVKSQIGSENAIIGYFAVQTMAKQVKDAVEANSCPDVSAGCYAKANGPTTAEGLELAAQMVELYSVLATELEPVGVVGEFLGGALALAGEITSLVDGGEQGESALAEPVTDPAELGLQIEQRLSAAGSAFDHAWDMLVSDPAKLNAAHQNFAVDPNNPAHKQECAQPGVTCYIWNGVPDDLDTAQPMMQNGVRHWAAGKFMASAFDVWMVDTRQIAGRDARDVTPADVHTIGCDRECSFGNCNTWPPFYEGSVDPPKIWNVLPEDAVYYFRDQLGLTQPKTPDPVPRNGGNMWVLAKGDISTKGGRRVWPPKDLLRDLYALPNTRSVGGGYGWERPWLYSRGQRFNFHSGWIRDDRRDVQRCFWFAQDRSPYFN
jgi:hypothetical protein